MKKFKTNELLSRDEMKKVTGASGYGQCGEPCGTYWDGAKTHTVYCKTHWQLGCSCDLPNMPIRECG